MKCLQSIQAGYEVQAERTILSSKGRYLVEWVVADEKRTKAYTYIARAETFAGKKRSAGFTVRLWDRFDMKYLTF